MIEDNTQVDRLTALRAAKKIREEAEELRAQAREIALLEQEEAAAEQLEHAEAEHGEGRVSLVMSDPDVGFVIVKAPALPTFRKFTDAGEKAQNSASFESLVRPCVVYPSLKEFDEINKLKPAVLVDCANAVCKLAGVKVAATSGK